MTDRVKNTILGVLAATSLALDGAAVAGAASDDNAASSTSTQAAASTQSAQPQQRSDETLLTGDTESRVRAAALARISGGTIERVETDADGHAAYEAHMLNAAGDHVTVYINEQFEVVSVGSPR
jgi:hypothetical protein